MSSQTAAIVVAILGMGAMIAIAVGLAIALRPTANVDNQREMYRPPQKGAGGRNGPGPTQPPSPEPEPESSEHKPDDDVKSSFGKYRKAAVQSENEVCSKIGMDIMVGRGGSATDAAIAVQACISTTLFHGAGIGGGHFMTVYDREKGTGKRAVKTLLAREVMPGVGHEDYYLTHDALHGGTAIGVPSIVHGLYTAWLMYGRIPWADLIAPSIKLAEEGFIVTRNMEQAINKKKPRLGLAVNINLKNVLSKPDGTLVKAGDTLKRAKFARTLKRISTDPMSFYNGSLADDIIADIQEAGGQMVKKDLVNYRTRVREPISGRLNNLAMTMYSPEPPSSGVVLQYILRIIDGFGFNASSLKDLQTTVATYQKMIEAFKFGFGRRSALADPLFWNVAAIVRNMTDEDFIAATRNKIDTTSTRDLAYYDHGYGFVEDTGTSHFSVLSPDGGGVGITATVNYYFGSEVYGTRTGIMFNNEMDDFSIPGATNVWNIAPSPSNFPKPGKMPMSSMSPSIFLNDNGEVAYISGAAGGPKIISSVAYVALHNLYFGLELGPVVDRPRLHHQLLPNILNYEQGFSQEILTTLQSLGHKIKKISPTSFVGVIRNYCASCKPGAACAEDCIHAVSDKRKFGKPYGY